ncbi:hypothetical protein E0K89_003870, partial [Aquicoccus sp. SCR17]|nr:hypothetical protein [Carideicomes alvinocaridis]
MGALASLRGGLRLFPSARFLAPAAILALTGCVAPGNGEQPPLSHAAFEGGVVVAGPDGYCIDRKALRAREGFALLASCLTLSEGTQGIWVEPALMTVTASRAGGDAPTAEVLGAALEAEALLSQKTVDGLAIAHLARGGEAALPGGDPRHWRGMMRLGDRLLGLAVYAPEGSDVAGRGGERLIRRL